MIIEKKHDKLVQLFAVNVRRLREKHGYTQEQMRDYGFNYRYYQKLESGTQAPNFLTLVKLADVFGVEVTDLLKP